MAATSSAQSPASELQGKPAMDQHNQLPNQERPFSSPVVEISVKNFGPINSAKIDLRPLTVFVGPSNTGKTYLAVLIYALHHVLGGFTRFPASSTIFLPRDNEESAGNSATEEDLHELQAKLGLEGYSLGFSDLPRNVRSAVHAYLNDPDKLARLIRAELLRCFDLDSISDLNQSFQTPKRMEFSLSVSEHQRTLWRFDAAQCQDAIVTNGHIENVPLLRQTSSQTGLEYDPDIHHLFYSVLNSEISKRIYQENQPSPELPFPSTESLFVNTPFSNINRLSAYSWLHAMAPQLPQHPIGLSDVSSGYYLPAARTGIMQSHRVIVSSLVRGAARAGLEPFDLPTLSGTVGDFLQGLINYDRGRRKPQITGLGLSALVSQEMHQKAEERSKPIKDIADALEREILSGQIQSLKPSSNAYPEFQYHPSKAAQDMRLSRASSMISELAPAVLFLRGIVEPGDMLFFEEPEAHLHPAAQSKMAVAITRIVRAGVRVLVTTHSDWLLKEIGNLIREGELEERTAVDANEQTFPSSLRPSEVGVWWFRRDQNSLGSAVEEIKFDRTEGVDPQEYEDVSDSLYSRSADLQNQLEELSGQSEPSDE